MTDKYYIFAEDINCTTVQKFIDDTEGHEKVRVYFTGDGGYYSDCLAMIEYISSREGITLVATDNMNSCSSLVYLLSDCEKEVSISFSFLMLHLVDSNRYRVRNNNRAEENSLEDISIKRVNKNLVKLLKPLLTKRQLKSFKKGNDVNVGYKQVKKIIEDATTKKLQLQAPSNRDIT